MRAFVCAALFLCAAFAQSTGGNARFEAADVHVSPHSDTNFILFMRGPQVRNGRYEIRTGTMVDLISAAYGIDEDNRVVGGPNWLAWDRYDITAKVPEHTTPDDLKKMLQALLAERFGLVVHNDTKSAPAYVLTANHPHMKAHDAASKDQKGCQGKPRPQNIEPGTIVQIEVSCHDLTMAEFADRVHQMAGGYLQNPVVDASELKGSFDFDLKWTGRGQLANAGADGISIFDAVDKQLGLKLTLQSSPTPVVVVDKVNETPTANPPDTASLLPGIVRPTEFEVADIKPTPDDFQGMNFRVLPSGQINVQGVNLKLIVEQAWQIFSDDMLVGDPKWLGEKRWDIVAKAPRSAMVDGGGPDRDTIDFDDVMAMLQKLLADRFKLQTHWEEKPINAYSLTAVKPRMKPADPNGRIQCVEGPGPDGKDPRVANPVLNRLLTCQNMTMTRFASMLMSLANGYVHAPALDATGLDGAYDFTLSFSAVGQLQGGRGGRGGDGPSAAAGGTAAGGTAAASDPNGALSLPDAIQKELGLKLELTKRPVKVLVIDHIEEKPTDN